MAYFGKRFFGKEYFGPRYWSVLAEAILIRIRTGIRAAVSAPQRTRAETPQEKRSEHARPR
jgi:hypothetical protein